MNKKIEELAKQADEFADATGLGGAEWCDVQLEKFAKLIVQECIMVLDHSQIRNSNSARLKLKEHFDIEEPK